MLKLHAPGEAVSVLICTRDRRDMLAALLSDLAAQTYDGAIEIVVVEETDDPAPPAGVCYVPLPVCDRGIAYARNRAIAEASHALIVFVDDDCRVGPEWLGRLLAPFSDPRVVAAQGGVTVPEGTHAIGWAESLLGFPGGGIRRVYQAEGHQQDTREVSTLNAAYRRGAVLRAGGFPEEARLGGEDYLLAKRVAEHGRVLFEPGAMVRHAARGSLPAVWHWFVRRGVAEYTMERAGLTELPFPTYLRYFLRSSIVVKLVVCLLLGLVSGWLPSLCVIAWAGVVVWRLHWAWTLSGIPKGAVWVAPWVKLVMDLGLDMGRLRAMMLRE